MKSHPATTHNTDGAIRIRGARQHNLRGVDLDVPHNQITVITGVSGSGKSSLAFDTLYAEGQRQYIDSLSAYARQFLDQIPRPDVDSIDGLAPTLAIDQKTGATGSRSTVATVTEIYDYLRLLFARAGTPHCAVCGSAIAAQTVDDIGNKLVTLPDKTKLVLMAPMVRGRRGAHREVLESIQKAGLVRARVDGEMMPLEEIPPLAPRKNHTIEAVIDRLMIREGIESRLRDSIDLAVRLGDGLLSILVAEGDAWRESIYSTQLACIDCGSSFAEIEPRMFSFNSPHGACPQCDGLGTLLSDDQSVPCDVCDGSRLRAEARSVTIGGMAIDQLNALSLTQADQWLETSGQHLTGIQTAVADPIVREVRKRLGYLRRVGVDYLTLDRSSDSLSGGEMQRVRLATSIGSGLVGVCYVLDEPSIGLHPADHDQLIGCITELKDQGNTIVIVEHDETTMRMADKLVDVGPGAGSQGGVMISQGPPEHVAQDPASLTGQFLSGKRRIPVPHQRRTFKHAITLSGVKTHNLKNITATFPLATLIGVSGVSGSGKSSLVNDTLYPAIAHKLGLKAAARGAMKSIRGAGKIDKLIPIDQSPIGRSSRSCPATYCGVFDEIRKVFAATRQAKTRGFAAGRFSFNSSGGQCELCKGQGTERIAMNFLSDLFVTCTRCGGKRFNRQTLQIKFKGASIADVLDLSIDEAAAFFENIPKIARSLSSLQTVGLGYLHLGQSSTTLSGGEAQRLKLGTELSRTATGKTLYLMDEPTTGLHFADVERLVNVLQQLVDAGNTVVVIEHQFDLLAACDWIIDMGPGGGIRGGQVVIEGTPETVAQHPESVSGRFLAQALSPSRALPATN